MLDILREELTGGIPDTTQLARVAIRLVMAMLLGAVIGFDRERTGKPAGLRTHMLVALGAALFVLVPSEIGLNLDGLSRVVQGVATGIGFLGAGAILKSSDRGEIKGLTTAAGIWLTAAMGVAVGLGRLGAAILTAMLAWLILEVADDLAERIRTRPSGYRIAGDGEAETAPLRAVRRDDDTHSPSD